MDEVTAEETDQAAETKSHGCKSKQQTGCGKENILDTNSPDMKRNNINFSQLLSTDHLANIIQTIAITFNLTTDH